MGGPAPNPDGVSDHAHQHEGGADNRLYSLADHPAIRQHGTGVAPEFLADFIMSMARMSAARVQGIGAQQYGGEIQKFELMNPSEIYQALLEEVADIFAYASFLAIKAGAAK